MHRRRIVDTIYILFCLCTRSVIGDVKALHSYFHRNFLSKKRDVGNHTCAQFSLNSSAEQDAYFAENTKYELILEREGNNGSSNLMYGSFYKFMG